MIGLVDGVDAAESLLDRQGCGVYLLALGDDAGNGAEPAGDADRADVGIGRQAAREHLGVELVGFAIDVEPGARKVRLQQGRTKCGGVGHQFVDVGILGPADGGLVETRSGKKTIRIARAAVAGVEDQRQVALGWVDDFEGGLAGEVGWHGHGLYRAVKRAVRALRTWGCCQLRHTLSTVVKRPNKAAIHAIFTGVRINRPIVVRGNEPGPPILPMSRILLAEDDHDMRRFLAKALQNAGHDVVAFDNGLSAYQRIREEPFTLLLTDIVMPEMDGIELARRATEFDPDLKVMFITGFAAVALNPDSNAPKDAKVLSKPFHLRDLVNEVEKLLAA